MCKGKIWVFRPGPSMESGMFQTAAGSWNWSVDGVSGAKCFHCNTSEASHTFSMERELVLDFGRITDETARRLLAHVDTCLILRDGGNVIARINRVAEHRAFHEADLGEPPLQVGRVRVSVKGRRARRVTITKPLGDHLPGELLEIVRDAS